MSDSYKISMTDLNGPVSFGGGGGGGGGGGIRNRIDRALTKGRARAVARGGGYSDGGNWRTALDTNANGRVVDDLALGAGVVASVSPAGRVVNTMGRIATAAGVIEHYR